ncbi:SusD/RagB family nutrient-binding outer membrane lipoprotein [Segetibacter sp. 3557_3]|uniref:SusD/RagB family nutrient-binding outer membrane lipoprotein n=1 Tax=Segetibacter sp. 3557_3 TaxID=2547429 RepID=UPI001058EB41|nr:SusD/RagB family nutrient-binding outer membrane lipoprotein [Segetibacter sp. 3557_3]TDH28611.1 SusD/RagB family nutrient-binding outer membrane lipoprotein [Segetibacter sp. 3557_3]
MKKQSYRYLFLLACITLLGSCKKQLEEQFYNPEVYSKVENLYGGIFLKMLTENKVYSNDYGEFYWQLNSGTEVPGYAQISQRHITDRYAWYLNYDDLGGTGGFGGLTNNLWNNRLNDFYTRARFWAVLKDELEKLNGQALADNKIYYSLATVIKDYVALVNVDFYNHIPYFDAFKGRDTVFYAKFDEPLEIYKSVLNELKLISEELPATHAAMSPLGKSIFTQQDIALQGDINRWIQYINALRLKYAVRISGVDEATAKTHLQDLLTKPMPATDLTWSLTVDVAPESNGFWLRGMYENYFATFIPDIIMRRMHRDSAAAYQPGVDDPRLQVLAMPTKYFAGTPSTTVNRRKYIGVSYNTDAQKPAYVAGERYVTSGASFILSLQQNAKSQYNYTTFFHNAKFPAYMMSVAEVDLLLAEVALKNLAPTPKQASQYIKDAISHSTDFWYARNEESRMAASFRNKAIAGNFFTGPLTFNSNRFGEDSALYFHPAKPSATVINQYSDSIATRFNSRGDVEAKMEILMQQKYIHLNIMSPFELWTELRRTRHPYLEPMTFTGKVMTPFPERLKYPQSALQTNTEFYMLVKDQDNFTTPIFWVPANKRSVKPYWPNYNYE